MSAAREAILRRVGELAPPGAAVGEVPREYEQRGERGAAARVDLFCERAADYRASVHRVAEAELEAALTARCEALGARRLGAAAAAPWRPGGVELELDEPAIDAARLDRLDGVLTGCAAAIAATGTVVLDGSPRCGHRALTLVPDLHLCVVAGAEIVETVPEAIAALAAPARAGAPLTFVSGPSATSDIELRRVDGVHGPRRLELFVWY
ncbi:MAG: LUD domain-containing protein [Solirubrobacterales bacterium]